jgi:hypothetical protein
MTIGYPEKYSLLVHGLLQVGLYLLDSSLVEGPLCLKTRNPIVCVSIFTTDGNSPHLWIVDWVPFQPSVLVSS